MPLGHTAQLWAELGLGGQAGFLWTLSHVSCGAEFLPQQTLEPAPRPGLPSPLLPLPFTPPPPPNRPPLLPWPHRADTWASDPSLLLCPVFLICAKTKTIVKPLLEHLLRAGHSPRPFLGRVDPMSPSCVCGGGAQGHTAQAPELGWEPRFWWTLGTAQLSRGQAAATQASPAFSVVLEPTEGGGCPAGSPPLGPLHSLPKTSPSPSIQTH